jgi:hypothetical protein
VTAMLFRVRRPAGTPGVVELDAGVPYGGVADGSLAPGDCPVHPGLLSFGSGPAGSGGDELVGGHAGY